MTECRYGKAGICDLSKAVHTNLGISLSWCEWLEMSVVLSGGGLEICGVFFIGGREGAVWLVDWFLGMGVEWMFGS